MCKLDAQRTHQGKTSINHHIYTLKQTHTRTDKHMIRSFGLSSTEMQDALLLFAQFTVMFTQHEYNCHTSSYCTETPQQSLI